MPLFESVMNSFQSIQDAEQSNHKVTIAIEREPNLIAEDLAPIIGFTITDTGVGFNDSNFDSFNTSFSDYKLSRGGKGLGRFTWLKAFDHVLVKSIFVESDAPEGLQRSFRFDEEYDPDKSIVGPVTGQLVGTTVKLVGYKEPYKSECPRTMDQIAQRLIEHFLLVFLHETCPSVEIHDGGLRLKVNEIFDRDFRRSASDHEFEIRGQKFRLHGFRLTTPRVSRHRLVYAANSRAVVSDNLEDFIPNLKGRLFEKDGTSFVYMAIVQGAYLNQRVNNARTDFDLRSGEDAEVEEPELFADEIQRSEIRNGCIDCVQKDLSEILQGIDSAKQEKVERYVQAEAPQYKILLRRQGEFMHRISPMATNAELEAALHHELYQREVVLKKEGARIITEAAKLKNYDEYRVKLGRFMEDYNELGVSALTQYVMHRRIILDFLEKSISLDEGSGKYPLEKIVHDIIFPMKSTTDDTLYSQQNLWIVDERLNYHSFVSSDKPLSTLDQLENESKKRPDLFIFDRKIAFSEGEQPLNSLTVVEFKRPQRDDYSETDNPLDQVFGVVQDIRAGSFLDGRGRPVSVAGKDIPANCYVICDLTASLRKILLSRDATATPDGQAFYGFHKNYGIYFEVTDYNKILRDAKRRNRIFFEKLNVLG